MVVPILTHSSSFHALFHSFIPTLNPKPYPTKGKMGAALEKHFIKTSVESYFILWSVQGVSFVPLGFVPLAFGSLNKGIWDPKLRGTRIKGTNLKSLICCTSYPKGPATYIANIWGPKWFLYGYFGA